MTHVQIAGDVRKGQHHHELLLIRPRVRRRREEAGAVPPVVQLGLDDGRTEVLLAEIEDRCGWCGTLRVHQSPPYAISAKQKALSVPGRTAPWYHLGFR